MQLEGENSTNFQFNEIVRRGKKQFQAEIVAQRNNPRIIRHQTVQLQCCKQIGICSYL